jgi:hypothetical protein
MRTYAMSYREVMAMPARAFWTLSGFVERLRADEAITQLEIITKSQDGDTAQDLYERLTKQAPAPVTFTGHAMATVGAERDESGFAELRSLAG